MPLTFSLRVKLPALPRGASGTKSIETAPKQLDLVSTEAQPAFAQVATARSPIAIAQRRRSRGASACAACAPRVLPVLPHRASLRRRVKFSPSAKILKTLLLLNTMIQHPESYIFFFHKVVKNYIYFSILLHTLLILLP